MGLPFKLLNGDKDTLYFIGNGFDLFHEVKSKFIHFYSWLNLKDHEHEKFVTDMENIYPKSGVHGNMLWTDFEKALGSFNIEDVHNKFAGKELDGFHDEEYQHRAAKTVHEVFSKIPLYLKEWAIQISTGSIDQRLVLGINNLYLTFNYTLLLEKVYHIPLTQIWHVHGSIADDKPLITGHKEDLPLSFYDVKSYNDAKSLEYLSGEIQGIRKPVESIIDSNKDYFESLGHINRVIVFGHSLSPIDYPYFMKIVRQVHDDTKWIFVVYNDETRSSYEKIVSRNIQVFNDPKCIGFSQYRNKIKPENCEYINIEELK